MKLFTRDVKEGDLVTFKLKDACGNKIPPCTGYCTGKRANNPDNSSATFVEYLFSVTPTGETVFYVTPFEEGSKCFVPGVLQGERRGGAPSIYGHVECYEIIRRAKN